MSEPWFAAKRYGIGAGPPIAWQGWAASILYVALVAVAGWQLDSDERMMAILTATVFFILLTAFKTEGGWRWRWGE